MKGRNHSNVTFLNGCSQKTQMKQHVISAHEGKKPFKCHICGYSCSQIKKKDQFMKKKKAKFKYDFEKVLTIVLWRLRG